MMSDEQETEWRQLLPQAKFFDMATQLVAGYDRLLVTLYSALIAGIVLLLIKEEVSLWVGAFLVLSLVCFVLGIGHTLLHMAFLSKMLLLAEALVNQVEVVPNAIEEDEATVQAYARNQAYAQRAYAAQLWYLVIGMGFGAVAVFARLWAYAWRAGVIGLALLVCLAAIAALVATWRKTARRFPPSTVAGHAENPTPTSNDD